MSTVARTGAPPPPPAEPSRYVTWYRNRCPACHSADLHTYRSIPQPDSSVLRYVRCRACGWRFVATVE
jgi:hypothetical protein